MRGFEFPYYQNGRRFHVFIVFAYAGVIFCKYISFIKLRRDLLTDMIWILANGL